MNDSWQEAFEDLDDGWKLTSEMKEALHGSPWLERELQDEGLRQALCRIVSASHNVVGSHHHHRGINVDTANETEQEQLLRQKRTSCPAFAAFLDKAMVVAGVLERQGKEADTNMEEWLEQKTNTQGPLNNVSLKPLPSRQRPPTFLPVVARKNGGMQDEGSSEDSETSSDEDSSSTSSSEASSEE